MTDEKRIKRFIEGAKKAFKEVDDPTFTFPMNILSAYELATGIEELLKTQEPIPCGEKIKAGDVVLDFYKCGYCKNAIRKPWRYCPFCGKEAKWYAVG